jgi:diadenylate cyclase
VFGDGVKILDIINTIVSTVKNISFLSMVDILVVSYIFYKLYMLIQETRAEQLLKGIILILILIPVSNFLHLTVLNWILSNTIPIGVISLVIIFQPEVRRALEHIGRSAFADRHLLENNEKMEEIITEIVEAVDIMAKTRTGAIIILEQRTGMGEIIETGTKLDALVSSHLLENIFVVNTPLHDGAAIIRDDRIAAAGCFLPLSDDNEINKKLGTRHRAAIGISETTDAITIVVSEETGTISLAVNGRLTRNYSKERLKDIIIRIMKNRQLKRHNVKEKMLAWKKKRKSTS